MRTALAIRLELARLEQLRIPRKQLKEQLAEVVNRKLAAIWDSGARAGARQALAWALGENVAPSRVWPFARRRRGAVR